MEHLVRTALVVVASLSIVFTASWAQQGSSQNQTPAGVRVMITSDRVAGFADHTTMMLGLFDTSGLVVTRERFLAPGSRRDPLSALVAPARRPADGADFPGAKEPVVMLEVDGLAVAYPLGALIYHAVINDTIGDTPVAIWYDPISGGLAAFRRDVPARRAISGAETPREFRLSGLLLHGSSVLYDRGTKSLFSPLEGRGLSGPFADARLDSLPFRVLSFDEFRAIRRAGEVVARPMGTTFDYSVNPYAEFQLDPGIVYMQVTNDQRTHPKASGVGIASPTPERNAFFVPLTALDKGDRSFMTDAGSVVVGLTPEGTVVIKECPPGVTVAQTYFANWVSAHPTSSLAVSVDVRDLPISQPR